MKSKAVTCNDPLTEPDRALEKVGDEAGADLVVMASHVPGFMDYLFHANTSHLGKHDYIFSIHRSLNHGLSHRDITTAFAVTMLALPPIF